MSRIKRIAVLTSGGDCSGMNAAIRAVVRCAIFNGLSVFGVMRGYEGLIKGDMKQLNRRSVSNIINMGGTILKTARSKEFMTKNGQRKALRQIAKFKIDGLAIIGGDGSFRGAHILCADYGVRCIGIPGTIDNDINGTDFTIGSDTAVNVALDAIDKIRDTVSSLERIFVVEIMGRECGYIAARVALAGGAEDVLMPEMKFDMSKICREINAAHKKGKLSWILLVAEGVGSAHEVAKIVQKKTGYETRVTVLGHIQRGGRPTAQDRILAARLGAKAVELLIQGESDKMAGIVSDRVMAVDLEFACNQKSNVEENTKKNIELYKLTKILEA
ncbi:MAG: 6-phosphofructokinase [Candidatus Omnitrophota bacterium]